MRKLIFVVSFLVVSSAITAAAPRPTSADQTKQDIELITDIDIPDRLSRGEQGNVNASISAPNIPYQNLTWDVSITITIDGQIVLNDSSVLTDGSNVSVSHPVQFPTNGTHNVSVRIQAEGPVPLTKHKEKVLVVGSPLSGLTTVTGLSVTPSGEVRKLVKTLRSSGVYNQSVFVLLTNDTLYLIETNRSVAGEVLTVTGAVQQEYSVGDFSVSRLAARNVTTNAAKQRVNLSNLYEDPFQHRFQLIETHGTHLQLSSSIGYSGANSILSVGVLTTDDSPPPTVLQPYNATISSQESILNQLPEDTSIGPHIYTISTSAGYWSKASAVLDGFVITPGTTAYQYLNQTTGGQLPTREGGIVLYTVYRDVQPEHHVSVSEISNRPESLDGEIVTVTGSILTTDISSRKLVPTLPVDVHLQTGVLWEETTPNRNSTVFLVGVTAGDVSADNNSRFDFPVSEAGTYDITGRVIIPNSTGDMQPVLIVQEMTFNHYFDGTTLASSGENAATVFANRTEMLRSRVLDQIQQNQSFSVALLDRGRVSPNSQVTPSPTATATSTPRPTLTSTPSSATSSQTITTAKSPEETETVQNSPPPTQTSTPGFTTVAFAAAFVICLLVLRRD